MYLPVTGAGSEQLIDLILTDLQAYRSNVTILGNEEMAHAQLSDAKRNYFDIYYSSFFHRDNNRRETYRFQNDFLSLTGFNPDDFAHLGFDVATFLFNAISELQNPARLKDYLRHRPFFEGVITNIDFRGSHINHSLHFLNIERHETVIYRDTVNEDNGDDAINDR